MRINQLTVTIAALFCCNLHAITLLPNAPIQNNKAYILMEADSGQVLAAYNADMQLAPASLTKMMTSYMVEQALSNGSLKENDTVTVPTSAECVTDNRISCMFIAANTEVKVIDALRGLIIQSGNDAASALAHKLAANEATFALQMNQQAAQLGMRNTHFKNASGLPQPGHYSSARDIAILGSAIVKHSPKYFPIYKEMQFSYNGILQANRNSLLAKNAHVDGFKTGHTNEAGYCLAATSLKHDMRLIAVVLGAPSSNARGVQTQQLLDWGYQHYAMHHIRAKRAPTLKVPVWFGSGSHVSLAVKPIQIVAPKGKNYNYGLKYHINQDIKAPISQNQPLGHVDLYVNQIATKRIDIVAANPVAKARWYKVFWHHILRFLP